ncbi:colicin-like pore-forming protein, partial [Enterobacter hormaechei]|uniref:colicin-like pore-forming protein n=2 Tax=Enterobacter TaxID=547 RepID=UPI00331460B8
KARDTLNSSKKNLANAQAEVTAAQKALDDANKALPAATANKKNADNAVASAADMKDAITTTTAFFESVSKKFGERAARLAQELAAQARSAKIRSVPEAIALFDKYKGTAVNKLNAADKAAIANAFKSLDQAAMAKQLAAYSKVLGRFNKAMDIADLGAAVKKGIETGNWSDAINKLESIALTNTAGQLAAIAFAAAGAPLGIVGFGIVMTLSGVLFSDEKVLSAINTSLGM